MYHEIESLDDLNRVLEGDRPVMFFKHSISCGVSTRALAEFRRYLEIADPGQLDHYLIVVQAARPVSDRLAGLTGVVHESPQAIIVREGRAIWHDSHLALKSGTLLDAVRSIAG